jgi:hypothetical protein
MLYKLKENNDDIKMLMDNRSKNRIKSISENAVKIQRNWQNVEAEHDEF